MAINNRKLLFFFYFSDTTVNYLPGQEEYNMDLLEIITVYKSLKDAKIS